MLNACQPYVSPVTDGMRSSAGKYRTATGGDPLKLRDCRSNGCDRLCQSGADVFRVFEVNRGRDTAGYCA